MGLRAAVLDRGAAPPYPRFMEILLGFVLFAVALALLGLGTILFRRPLQGSCGGAARLLGRFGGGSCGVCGRPFDECPEKNPDRKSSA
jgi:hypothetical protein